MAKKKLKSHIWPGHTADEMRTITALSQRLGPLTYIRPEVFERPWTPVPGATWPRCPDCGTWWEREKWPKCQWCHFVDKGASYDYGR